MKKCSECGQLSPDETAFCINCGMKLSGSLLERLKTYKSFYVYVLLSIIFLLNGGFSDNGEVSGISGAFIGIGGVNGLWAFYALFKPKNATFGFLKSRGIALIIFFLIAGLFFSIADKTKTSAQIAAEEMKKQVQSQQKETEAVANQQKKEKEATDNIALQKKRLQETEERAQREKEQLMSAPVLNYEDLARYPDKYTGKPVQFTGKVIQVMEAGGEVQLRINTKQTSYGWDDDTVFVFYQMETGEARILDGDVVRIYGKSKGIKKYKTVMGNELSIPSIDAKILSRK